MNEGVFIVQYDDDDDDDNSIDHDMPSMIYFHINISVG